MNLNKYIEEHSKETLTKDQEFELFEKYKNGDNKSFELLILHNLRLVFDIAQKYTKTGANIDIDDAFSLGLQGLMTAIEKFDYTKNYKFSTYSVWWIRQKIQRFLAEKSTLIRNPDWINSKKRRLEREGKSLDDVKCNNLESFLQSQKISSLDYMQDDSNSSFGDTIPETDDKFQGILFKDIESIINELKPKYRFVINHRFGIKNHAQMTLDDVGKHIGVTRERVRQIEKIALGQLKNKCKRLGIDQNYLEGSLKECSI